MQLVIEKYHFKEILYMLSTDFIPVEPLPSSHPINSSFSALKENVLIHDAHPKPLTPSPHPIAVFFLYQTITTLRRPVNLASRDTSPQHSDIMYFIISKPAKLR